MSINLHCKLVLPGQPDEEIPLIQTPTMVTDRILGKLVEVKNSKKAKNKTSVVRQMYLWQEQARNYLRWVEDQAEQHWGLSSPDPEIAEHARQCVKRERRMIGRAWRRADEAGGRLVFSGW